ncbi:MAG TPA: class I SAM-dependent methyltransferase [Bacillota bacterium]|nr:class I SAM-dependent methyltransferase [Bacillota bacterium]
MAGTVMDEELSRAYYLMNEELFRKGEWHRELESLKLDFKGRTVLDLAAGTGHWEEVFLSLGAGKVIWQDLSQYFFRKAAERMQGYNNVEFLLGDMTFIPMDDESVDFVMCRDSLYHSPDENKTLSEVYRVLKKEGHFYLSFRNWRRIFREPFTWKSPLKLLAPHFYRITGKKTIPTVFVLEAPVLSLLGKYGFRIEKMSREDSVSSILASK